MMLPIREEEITLTDEKRDMTTKTHQIQIFGDRIYNKIDGLKAMEQACYKILNTERYAYAIYSWNYGIELKDLFGKPKSYCKVELINRIREALLQDERNIEVESFSFKDLKRNVLAVSFTVKTIFGDLELVKEVQI